MENDFKVQCSQLHGKGLFAKRDIHANTIYIIETSRPRQQDFSFVPNTYILDYFLPNSDNYCIQSNKLVEVSTLQNIHPHSFTPRFVGCDHLCMMANDLAWPATSEKDYEKNVEKNKICLLLEFSNTATPNIIGIKIYVTQDIKKNEEVGNSYGYDFWTSHTSKISVE